MGGVRAVTRADARQPMDPKKELFGWMIIQAVTSGAGFAGLVEAQRSDSQAWNLVFLALLTGVLCNYFWVAWTWASWWRE